jgi:hypothetical protein
LVLLVDLSDRILLTGALSYLALVVTVIRGQALGQIPLIGHFVSSDFTETWNADASTRLWRRSDNGQSYQRIV